MKSENSSHVTGLLRAWRAGQEQARDELMPLVYEELRRLAQGAMRGERANHTLQPTALVHEAYARLVEVKVDWQDRAHFLAVMALTMRRVLVDHAKARSRDKRGGGALRVTLDEGEVATAAPGEEILALHEALERLSERDSRMGQAVELHYFGGLTYDEMAQVLSVSAVTVHRDLRLARTWLAREMSQGSGDES
jgi:RNA polymerase sigma factor (TIGR02999 family)